MSDVGIEVVRHELRMVATGRAQVTARLLELAGAEAEVYLPGDLAALADDLVELTRP